MLDERIEIRWYGGSVYLVRKELFHLHFRARRLGAGVTQSVIEETTGVKQAVISKFELGETFPRRNSLEKLIQFFNDRSDLIRKPVLKQRVRWSRWREEWHLNPWWSQVDREAEADEILLEEQRYVHSIINYGYSYGGLSRDRVSTTEHHYVPPSPKPAPPIFVKDSRGKYVKLTRILSNLWRDKV